MTLFDINNNIQSSKSKASLVDDDYVVGWDSVGKQGRRFPISAISTKVHSDPYSDTYWDDLRVPITATKLGGTKDPDFSLFKNNGAASQGVFIYWFDDTTEEEVYFAAQIPHGYKYGTDLHPHVHWAPDSNGGAGEVVNWGLEYSIAEIGSGFGNTTIIYANAHTPADASLVASQHYVSEFSSISGTAIDSVSAMIAFRLFRDATGGGGTDDYSHDAGVLEFDLHYQIDAPGSNNEYTK